MRVVPVIDIRHGVAVAATRGDRTAYRPLESPLAKSCAPADVAAGYLALYPFDTIYIADLDGIEGRGANLDLVRRLADRFAEVELWLDCGAASTAALVAAREAGAIPVIGSESLRDPSLLETRIVPAGGDPGNGGGHPQEGSQPEAILSLDFRGEAFQGPATILDTPDLWPRRVIAMTLAKVGSAEGPDLDRLRSLKAAAGPRQLYAAGGVRDGDDLEMLRALGISGALVATAFHGGRIGRAELARLAALP